MQFLARHGLHGILADDMGLGKTLQTLTHILTEKQSGHSRGLPVLVIAPTSVVPNWRAEANKFTPDLRVLVLDGPDRKKYYPLHSTCRLVLTSFALLQRDIELLASIPFHIVVLDEAQNIKNPRARWRRLPASSMPAIGFALSGTPVENHLGELWSQMNFLVPGFLGTEDAFNKRFRTPIEKNGDMERNADAQTTRCSASSSAAPRTRSPRNSRPRQRSCISSNPRGLRNAVGLRWIKDELYATNMGSDHLGDHKPADTMYLLKNATNYGWPYCYQSGVTTTAGSEIQRRQ